VSSLDDLKYFFDANKISDVNLIKNRFKQVIKNNAEQWFKPSTQGGFGSQKMKQLFGDVEDADELIYLIDNDVNFSNQVTSFVILF
jgi:hypothetical protein